MDSERQVDEVTSMTSIFEDFSVCELDGLKHVCFSAYQGLPLEFTVFFNGELDTASAGPSTKSEELWVRHLPPISLEAILPADYPSTSAPNFTVSCPWLTAESLEKISAKLVGMWEHNHNTEILFLWATYLKEDVLNLIGIKKQLIIDTSMVKEETESKPEALNGNEGNEAKSEEQLPNCETIKECVSDFTWDNLRKILMKCDRQKRKMAFKAAHFSCGICIETVPGSLCMKFSPCEHVFCKQCLSKYVEIKIREMVVYKLKCPSIKCECEIYPSQIRELVGDEMFKKYDDNLLTSALQTMDDVIFCPRPSCRYPVIREDIKSNLAVCPMCDYAFCVKCKRVFHGIEPCFLTNQKKKELLNSYTNSNRNDKRLLEKKYGKKLLVELVEESLSKDWIKTNTRDCPHCHAAIEKKDGCNLMTCWRCANMFCWLCECLLKHSGYRHFNSAKSKCYNMLFHGLEVE